VATYFHNFHISPRNTNLAIRVWCKGSSGVGPKIRDRVRKIRYRTGLDIPISGIYLVRHKEHRLPHEVTLLKGEKFPPCAECQTAVQFELLMGITDMSLSPFRVTLHQIPEIEDTKAAAVGKEKVS
jgi:hypothetical protein